MKKHLMWPRLGLTSARPGTILPVGGPALLVYLDGVAVQPQQEKSVRRQVQVSRTSTLIARAATGVLAAPAPEAGDCAPTKHTGNGGSRGPYPWRQPPVIV
ncbi:hypothetical protein [Streptosporangium sp. NPDC006007]|uniref:hypothetical protein n=1 Tax=Streptosporangium sp. NPDC006007 TaxID=3154575 RepID=UPI0033B64A95